MWLSFPSDSTMMASGGKVQVNNSLPGAKKEDLRTTNMQKSIEKERGEKLGNLGTFSFRNIIGLTLERQFPS